MLLPLLALLLAGFESPPDLDSWNADHARVELSRDHATQGQSSLQLTLGRGPYPGIAAARALLTGWADYDLARLDIFNPQSEPVTITIRIDDAQSQNYATRYNEGFTLRPGASTIELPVRRLQTSDRKRNLDPAQLRRFMIFGDRPLTLYLDNFRLEQGAISEWPELKSPVPYFGIDHEWWPGKDIWREEVLPRAPGTDRRAFEKHFYLEPYRPAPNPARIRISAARGQTVHIFFNTDQPPAGQNVRAVQLRERGGNGIFRVTPMAIVPVTNAPHATRFCATFRFDEPGSHTGKLAGIAYEIRVWPFALPAADIPFGFYYAASAQRDAELRDMAEHGCTSVTVPCPRPRADGSLETEPVDEFLAACRRAGLKPGLMPSLKIAQVIAGDYAGPEFSPQFLRIFEPALRNLKRWWPAVLANPVDEPREQALEGWNRNFADTKRYLELYRAAGISTLVTFTGDESFGKSYVRLVPLMDVVSTHPTRDCSGLMKAARELHIYNAGLNRVSWGFYPWAVGAKGRWEWHYSFWTDAYNPFAPGTGVVMPSPAGPVPTEAYERVRAGIDDYRFLMLAQRLPAARKLLDEIRGKIPRYLEGDLPGEETLDEWRTRLAEIIAAESAVAAE